MSITETKLIASNSPGSWSIDLSAGKAEENKPRVKREYEKVYRVKTDNPLDDQYTVLRAFNAAKLGDRFSSAGGASDSKSICYNISASLEKPTASQTQWLVSVNFGTPDVEKPSNANLTELQDISIGTAYTTRPVEKAVLRTPLARIGRRIGDTVPVTNASGEILIPPLEMEVQRNLYMLTSYYKFLPLEHIGYKNVVNSDDFTLTVGRVDAPVFTKRFGKYTIKMSGIQVSRELVNADKLWRVAYDLEEEPRRTHDDKDLGWREEVLNAGFSAVAILGAFDGVGGTWGTAQTSPGKTGHDHRLVLGVPPRFVIRDGHGSELPTKSLLSLSGEVLRADEKPTYIIYSIYDEANFAKLRLGK